MAYEDKDEIVVFKVSDCDHDFPDIEGPEPLVRQSSSIGDIRCDLRIQTDSTRSRA
jgi:hypothetical protein